MSPAGLSRHQAESYPKLPAASGQKSGLEHWFKKWYIVSSLDTKDPVWENADIDDCDLKSNSKEYKVTVTI